MTYDIYAAKETVILARGKVLVDTDISMAVLAGTYMFPLSLAPISPSLYLFLGPIYSTFVIVSPCFKNFIDTGAGVIDADYRGQVKVLLFNHSENDFDIKEGDSVAQLVLERMYTPDVVEAQELEESVRGAGGFGRTG